MLKIQTSNAKLQIEVWRLVIGISIRKGQPKTKADQTLQVKNLPLTP